MRAHTREIERHCPAPCGKRATVEVFGARNETYGVYCREHGRKKVDELQEAEAKDEVVS